MTTAKDGVHLRRQLWGGAAVVGFRWISRFAVTALALSFAQIAAAQDSLTLATKVYPLMQSGKLTGCQLAFSVLRADREFNNGEPALANGLLLFFRSGAVSLRLGVANDAAANRFLPPARAFLYGKYKSNVADFVKRELSTEPGFALFLFKLGDATTSMIGGLLETGTIEIVYAPDEATVDARFSLNIEPGTPEFSEFLDCMETLLSQ